MTDETKHKLGCSLLITLMWIAVFALIYLAVIKPRVAGLIVAGLVIVGTIALPWLPDDDLEPKREPRRGIDRFAGRDGF